MSSSGALSGVGFFSSHLVCLSSAIAVGRGISLIISGLPVMGLCNNRLY